MRTPSVSLLLLLLALAAPARAQVTITGAPVAPPGAGAGEGLCSASAESTNPAADFPQSGDAFVSGLNAFFERESTARVESVITTRLDLSNALATGLQASRGDFVDVEASCASFGCAFAYSDALTSFATRHRGYLVVHESEVGRPLHLGAYADDAVAITLFDATRTPYRVIVRPPALGFPTWRVTSSVTFTSAGLYPIEILHAQITDHAALEISLLDGSFEDFARPAGQPPVVELDTAGFELLPASRFARGIAAAAAAGCTQCDASAAGTSGGCASGERCNEAAVCEPCAIDAACGASCAPCEGSTPRCADVEGAWSCVACVADSDCDAGERCVAHACELVPGDAGVDAGSADDAGASEDAGSEAPARDAGATRDAGAAPPAESAGCGCAVASPGSRLSPLAALLALGALLTRRRRR